MKAGASGFLLKDVDPPGLCAAVRAVVRGDTLPSPTLTRRLIEHFLAEPTVKTHVTRMLAKLGLRDRVQAVVFAYESGLIEPGRS